MLNAGFEVVRIFVIDKSFNTILSVLCATRVLIFRQGGHHGHFYTLSRHYKLQYQCDP
jgi:hypothetical protein